MVTEKQVQKNIEKYIKQLKILLRRQPNNNTIKLRKPNDKHLRTYIKNQYPIKLLFPETLDIELSMKRKNVERFISNYKENKSKIIKKSTNKLNKTRPLVIK